MNYADEFNKASEKGKVDQISTNIHTWEEEGTVLIGKLVAVEPFTEGSFDTEVNKYLIDTDFGLVSTVLGSATDKQIARKIKPGCLMCIRFEGKKHLKDGKAVNLFNVRIAH